MGGLGGTIQGLTGVIAPSLPKRNTLLGLIVGVLIGLAWAYAISPIVYYDTDPSQLRQDFQNEWVKLLSDRLAGANADVSEGVTQLLTYVDNPEGIVRALRDAPEEFENQHKMDALLPLAQVAQPNARTAHEPTLIGNVLPFVLAPLVAVLVVAILVVVWNLLLYPLIEPMIARGGKGAGDSEASKQAAADIKAIKDAKKVLEEQKTDYSSTLGTPIMQKMSIYALGRGQYDDSFSIEDANERFLGECGAGISETIGTDSPEKVSAVEVWLFDKDDFTRTLTAVFASSHAFNDPATRAKLSAKGNVLLVQPGAVTQLETSALQLQARVIDVQYGSGAYPQESFFERLTIELAVWQKGATGAPVVTQQQVVYQQPPTAPAQTYAPPPVAPPTYQQPPAAPVYQPPAVQPPPVQQPPAQPPAYQPPPPAYQPPPPRQDDDPFGGTGDFTPLT